MNLGYQIFAFMREQLAIVIDAKEISPRLDRYGCTNCDTGHVYVDWGKLPHLHFICDVCSQMYYLEDHQ